jgi:hypothetical protein
VRNAARFNDILNRRFSFERALDRFAAWALEKKRQPAMEPQPNEERIHETWRKSLTWYLVSATLGFSLARQRRFSQIQPGATPQEKSFKRTSAESAAQSSPQSQT